MHLPPAPPPPTPRTQADPLNQSFPTSISQLAISFISPFLITHFSRAHRLKKSSPQKWVFFLISCWLTFPSLFFLILYGRCCTHLEQVNTSVAKIKYHLMPVEKNHQKCSYLYLDSFTSSYKKCSQGPFFKDVKPTKPLQYYVHILYCRSSLVLCSGFTFF